MAKLDLETSGESGGYSDSFELEESLSLDLLESSAESDTKNTNTVVPQRAAKKSTTLIDTHKASRGPSLNRIQTKPKVTMSGLTSNIKGGSQTNAVKHDGDDDDTIDLGRTIRSPLNVTTTNQSAVTSDVSSSHGKSRSKFKHAAQNVRTMQSVVNTVKSFNDSLEVRDSVYGDWLARKTSQVSREKSSKIQAKKLEDEKKRQKEVIYCTKGCQLFAGTGTYTLSTLCSASKYCLTCIKFCRRKMLNYQLISTQPPPLFAYHC